MADHLKLSQEADEDGGNPPENLTGDSMRPVPQGSVSGIEPARILAAMNALKRTGFLLQSGDRWEGKSFLKPIAILVSLGSGSRGSP